MLFPLWAKQKRPNPSTPHWVLHGSGAGLFGRWLRRFDIHDGFLLAKLAHSRQTPNAGVGVDFQNLPSPAHRAHDPSVLGDQSITFFL